MAKLTLSDVTNLENQPSSIAVINSNSALIETALENTFSRDGTSPNVMQTSIDMSSNRILNLPAATLDTEPVRLAEVGNAPALATAAAASAAAALISQTAAASSATSSASSATASAASATSAAASATTATTQASNASTSATNAATSATAAANSVAAIKWNFESSTSMAAPASGGYRLNNATLASVTAIAVNATDADGNATNAIVNTWDDSSSTVKGTLKIRKLSSSTAYVLFNVTSSVTDNSTWLQVTLTYVTSSGSFSASDACDISFSRTGDAGSGTLSGMSNHGIPVASSSTAITSSIALTDGQLIVGQTGADPLPKTITGDVTFTAAGATAIKTSVSLTTPVLGTPTSGTLTNCTGLPVAGITSSTSTALGVGTLELGNASDTTLSRASAGVMAVEGVSLYSGIPLTSKTTTGLTTVLADANTGWLHGSGDNNPRTFTIDSNANVAFPVGTTITFVNQINTVTIALTTDTLTLMGAGSTGSRTLAANGMATALKVSTTGWVISGVGLT